MGYCGKKRYFTDSVPHPLTESVDSVYMTSVGDCVTPNLTLFPVTITKPGWVTYQWCDYSPHTLFSLHTTTRSLVCGFT